MTNSTAQANLSKLLSYIEGAYAPNTIRAYLADMLEFISYCDKSDISALPASPATVASFLMQTIDKGINGYSGAT